MGIFTGIYGLVDAGGLPKSGPGHSIWPYAVSVLPPSNAEEVAFSVSHFANICLVTMMIMNKW